MHTKYISYGPHDFKEEGFKVFRIISLWKLLIPVAEPILIDRVYEGDHKILLRTTYFSCGPHVFREEFSHFNSMETHDPWDRASLEPRGLDWQDLCRGPLDIATYQIYRLWASWFQRNRVLKCFSIITL